ncbi:hypothetical protein ABT147_36060 [Streptomyces sp. NPDC001868]|uniref:hypothetical protein n=1 Tax=Streptomyces sp. NPDC001868 TaxID=3154401 RepID=UPI0033297C00
MTLISPNTVLANALTNVEDVLAPRIRASKPQRIALVVGTQINGAPHAGTSLVQSMAFATAARLRDRHGLPVEVRFSALDNAPHEIVTDPATGNRYQLAYAQALGTDGIASLVGTLYRPLFDALSERLSVPYGVETYSEQQQTAVFRETWLRVLPRRPPVAGSLDGVFAPSWESMLTAPTGRRYGGPATGGGQPVIVYQTIELDGRVVARQIFDPMRGEIRRRGGLKSLEP